MIFNSHDSSKCSLVVWLFELRLFNSSFALTTIMLGTNDYYYYYNKAIVTKCITIN